MSAATESGSSITSPISGQYWPLMQPVGWTLMRTFMTAPSIVPDSAEQPRHEAGAEPSRPSGGGVGEVLDGVRVDRHRAGAHQGAEADLVVAEVEVVRPLEPQPTRDADLERGPVAEVDRLRVGRHGREVRVHVDRLAE